MTDDQDRLIRQLARDEGLTRGLGDVDARQLVEWMVSWAEVLLPGSRSPDESRNVVARLIRRGRAIARFVLLWPTQRSAALQLAATERFAWPLPMQLPATEMMDHILNWEQSYSPQKLGQYHEPLAHDHSL
jgi:hypothetical protein